MTSEMLDAFVLKASSRPGFFEGVYDPLIKAQGPAKWRKRSVKEKLASLGKPADDKAADAEIVRQDRRFRTMVESADMVFDREFLRLGGISKLKLSTFQTEELSTSNGKLKGPLTIEVYLTLMRMRVATLSVWLKIPDTELTTDRLVELGRSRNVRVIVTSPPDWISKVLQEKLKENEGVGLNVLCENYRIVVDEIVKEVAKQQRIKQAEPYAYVNEYTAYFLHRLNFDVDKSDELSIFSHQLGAIQTETDWWRDATDLSGDLGAEFHNEKGMREYLGLLKYVELMGSSFSDDRVDGIAATDAWWLEYLWTLAQTLETYNWTLDIGEFSKSSKQELVRVRRGLLAGLQEYYLLRVSNSGDMTMRLEKGKEILGIKKLYDILKAQLQEINTLVAEADDVRTQRAEGLLAIIFSAFGAGSIASTILVGTNLGTTGIVFWTCESTVLAGALTFLVYDFLLRRRS